MTTRVDPAAAVARPPTPDQRAQTGTGRRPPARRCAGRCAAPYSDPREHVPAEVVGAEEMPSARRLEDLVEVLRVRDRRASARGAERARRHQEPAAWRRRPRGRDARRCRTRRRDDLGSLTARVLIAQSVYPTRTRGSKQRVDQVRGQVDQHRAEGEGQRQRLDHHVVAGEDRLDHPRPQARKREHRLDDDRPADGVREPHADQRDDRQQRGAQHVAEQHRPAVEPLGAREVDVRRRLHVDQR